MGINKWAKKLIINFFLLALYLQLCFFMGIYNAVEYSFNKLCPSFND
jgi:Na+-translocating ferredoxin:NAD+ oxidoreductase RnfA subunit